MAYRCGYADGYDDTCPVTLGPACGGGYSGGQYAAVVYAGVVPCFEEVIPPPPPGVMSNVEEYCILDPRCAN